MDMYFALHVDKLVSYLFEAYMGYENDHRVVLTLDAGGTNLVFSAVGGNNEIIEPLVLPSVADHLGKCLDTIVFGFTSIAKKLSEPFAAISLAFPGPADYPNGIIGDLVNLPAFRGGVALGPMLIDRFDVPVYINNDGNLFALGEAKSGLLPEINDRLLRYGSVRSYRNLIGVTIGTGLGGGIVIDGELLVGDNSAAGEICLLRHKHLEDTAVEEGVSIRAVRRTYAELCSLDFHQVPEPKLIHQIAIGRMEGNKSAAVKTFERLGEVLGDALANLVALIDGLIVVGGGLAGASALIFPSVIKELNGKLGDRARLQSIAFDLDDLSGQRSFLDRCERSVQVPGSDRIVAYHDRKHVGIGVTRLGTAKAIAIGAYAFALQQLDKPGTV